ncbi:MAG: hypothetical protein JXR80_00615 [Deltaproteobacteria bacterium]|nr:hypothetical protein [Deltaproteobacteria bacterium]
MAITGCPGFKSHDDNIGKRTVFANFTQLFSWQRKRRDKKGDRCGENRDETRKLHYEIRRQIILRVNQVLAELKLKQHPDKTYIGRAEKGIDFLGLHLSPEQVEVSQKIMANAKDHIARLYERNDGLILIGEYVKRLNRWLDGVWPKNEQGEQGTTIMLLHRHMFSG